jgi:cobalt-zinc-cadmium efflux system outer membrane protein
VFSAARSQVLRFIGAILSAGVEMTSKPRWELPLLAGVLALISGCHAGHPSPEQVKQVNALVDDRMRVDWDVRRLLDQRSPPVEPAGDLSLQQATELALQHNWSLEASSENLSIAHAQLVQAGLIQNPTLGQSSGFIFPISPHEGLPSMDGNITQVLNSIFTQPARVSVAQVQEVQANIDMATSAYTLAQQVDDKYQEMVHLARARKLLIQIQELYEKAKNAAEARQKVGIISTPELNRARLSYADAVRQVQHVTTQFRRAAREMNWLMGYSDQPHWTLPPQAVADSTQIPVVPQMDQLEQLGLKYRLDLLRADLDNRIGEHQLKLAKLGIIPEITLGVEIARDGQKNLSGGPYIPSITLPIFDPGLVAVELAKAQLRKAQKTYTALEGQVRQDVRTAYDNWKIAADDIQFYRQHLIPQQQENVRLMDLSFRLGNDDLDTLLNVYQNYVSQLQAYEDALQAYHDSTVALQQAVGLTWEKILADDKQTASNPMATTRATTVQSTATQSATTHSATTQAATTMPVISEPAP